MPRPTEMQIQVALNGTVGPAAYATETVEVRREDLLTLRELALARNDNPPLAWFHAEIDALDPSKVTFASRDESAHVTFSRDKWEAADRPSPVGIEVRRIS